MSYTVNTFKTGISDTGKPVDEIQRPSETIDIT